MYTEVGGYTFVPSSSSFTLIMSAPSLSIAVAKLCLSTCGLFWCIVATVLRHFVLTGRGMFATLEYLYLLGKSVARLALQPFYLYTNITQFFKYRAKVHKVLSVFYFLFQ